jgi:phosphatidylglycerophosphatase A
VSLGERLPGGLGIMTDDMIAGALAAVIIAGLRLQGLI